MAVDPKKAYGVGKLVLIDINQKKDVREKFDILFEDVDGLSRRFCAVLAELQDAYRIWGIYGLPYTSGVRLAGVGRKEPADKLALWSEVLILRTVRLTDKSKQSVSVFQFLQLDLDSGLKKKVEDLTDITEEKSKILRTTRDKFISHKDFVVAEHKIDIHDPGFTIHDIAEILESVGDILRCIYVHFNGENNIGFDAYGRKVDDLIEY